jgi:anti-repressor protein
MNTLAQEENAVMTFSNPAFGQVRSMEIGGEPWFVGRDVAEALGYGEGKSPANAIAKHVDDEDKGVTELMTPGGKQKVTVINESGLYTLILSSKLPTAKQFKRWVTAEVLPAIRKHGMYARNELLENPDLLIAALQEIKKERERSSRLEEANLQKEQIIQELQPKATYYDQILQSKTPVAISQIAKDYGMSARKMNQLLHDEKIQYKQGGTWLLYQKYADQGYTQSKTFAVDADRSYMHTYWTQKGRLFLYDHLKLLGILPRIERAA